MEVLEATAESKGNPQSDIDFLVDMAIDRSLLDRIGLMQDLEDLLGRKVDLATVKGLREFFMERIMSQSVSL